VPRVATVPRVCLVSALCGWGHGSAHEPAGGCGTSLLSVKARRATLPDGVIWEEGWTDFGGGAGAGVGQRASGAAGATLPRRGERAGTHCNSNQWTYPASSARGGVSSEAAMRERAAPVWVESIAMDVRRRTAVPAYLSVLPLCVWASRDSRASCFVGLRGSTS
jgi:hypothetical protein